MEKAVLSSVSLMKALRWTGTALALYVAIFQVMVLLIGQPETLGEWLGWNKFLFMPGLEYATAIQFLSGAITAVALVALYLALLIHRRATSNYRWSGRNRE
jgi:hypothetical protein